MTAAQLRTLAAEWEAECNREVYGQCSVRSCLCRGGWVQGDLSGFSKATCRERDTALALRTLANKMEAPDGNCD